MSRLFEQYSQRMFGLAVEGSRRQRDRDADPVRQRLVGLGAGAGHHGTSAAGFGKRDIQSQDRSHPEQVLQRCAEGTGLVIPAKMERMR